jgi:hypothetical protein
MLMMMRRPEFLMMRRPEFLMMRRPCAALRRPENPDRSASILLLVYLAMDEILKDSFVKGFLYQKILQLLEKFHGINISMRTLQQRLHSLGLKRKN